MIWADRFAIGIAIFAAFFGFLLLAEPFAHPLEHTVQVMAWCAFIFGGIAWVFFRTIHFMLGG